MSPALLRASAPQKLLERLTSMWGKGGKVRKGLTFTAQSLPSIVLGAEHTLF